jgi:hypothetical protein
MFLFKVIEMYHDSRLLSIMSRTCIYSRQQQLFSLGVTLTRGNAQWSGNIPHIITVHHRAAGNKLHCITDVKAVVTKGGASKSETFATCQWLPTSGW